MTGTPEERKKALFARVRLSADNIRLPSNTQLKARSAKPTLSESLVAGSSVIHRRADQEELKRRATLSRLEGVAEGVWM